MSSLPTLESLGLPSQLGADLEQGPGIVLVGGSEPERRTAGVIAIAAHLSRTRNGHLVTFERDIRWTIPHGQCLVTQRELGTDIPDDSAALMRAFDRAVRLPADVLAVTDLSDPPAVDRLLTVAQSSSLVLVSVPGEKPSHALDWLARIAGADHRDSVFTRAAQTLRTIVIMSESPHLLKITDESRKRIRFGQLDALDDVQSA